MVYYKLVKIMINAASLAEIMINVVVWYYKLRKSIVNDQGSLFILKFWFLLYHFLGIEEKFSIVFYLQTDG